MADKKKIIAATAGVTAVTGLAVAAADSRHQTKNGALSSARDLVHRMTPSRLVIQRSGGTIQRQHSYGVVDR